MMITTKDPLLPRFLYVDPKQTHNYFSCEWIKPSVPSMSFEAQKCGQIVTIGGLPSAVEYEAILTGSKYESARLLRGGRFL